MKKIIKSLLIILIVSFQHTHAMEDSDESLEENYYLKIQELGIVYESSLNEIESIRYFESNMAGKIESLKTAQEMKTRKWQKEEPKQEKFSDEVEQEYYKKYYNYVDRIEENHLELQRRREQNEREFQRKLAIEEKGKKQAIDPHLLFKGIMKEIDVDTDKFCNETIQEALDMGMSMHELKETMYKIIGLTRRIIEMI